MSRAIQGSLDDPAAYLAILDQFLAAKQFEAAAAYAHGVFDAGGLMATEAARLTGELLLAEANAAALFTYDRLLAHCQGDLAAGTPAPAPPQPLDSQALRALLARSNLGSVISNPELPNLHLTMARLCFSFSAFETAARLFQRAESGATLQHEDHIALAYALVKNDNTGNCESPDEVLGESADISSVGPDWMGLYATVKYARQAADEFQACIQTAVRHKFSRLPGLDEVVADIRRMTDCLSTCREELVFSTNGTHKGDAESVTNPGSNSEQTDALPKVFICGNGWSGSGALYDALTDYDSVAQTPDLAIDRFINECTDSEMMFVQGAGGLGRLWRQVRDRQQVSRMELWELVRCHVLGLGAIGHTEHKSANAASNLVQKLGSDYTAVYRRLIERIVGLPNGTKANEFRAVLVDATEQLTRVVTGANKENIVVFNNAMFGPNLDMVDIFSNFRLAVVVRDPLDQYADRRAQDLKHWMTPRRFVSFYRSSRKAFDTQRNRLQAENRNRVREIEFERFIRQDNYRHEAIQWATAGRAQRRVRSRFDPNASKENIGVHSQLLNDAERQTISKPLSQWRRS